MSPPASSGGLVTFDFQSIDASYAQVLVSLTCTGITVGLSENQAAFSICNQMNVLLQQMLNPPLTALAGIPTSYYYTGQPQFTSNSVVGPTGLPVFSSQLGLSTWRVNVSEHVLTIFSECDYDVTIVSDTSGCQWNISETPCLSTIAEARADGPLTGLVLTDVSGTPLTDGQVISLIGLASAKLIAAINNRIVICTRIHEETGWWQRSFFLKESVPGIYFDGVWAKRPYTFSLFGIFLGGSASVMWNYVRRTGELQYIPAQNAYYSYEPSSFGNEIKISYVGGYYKIPLAVQGALYGLMADILENSDNVKSLKDGTWGVTFDTNVTAINRLREELVAYYLF